MVDIGFMNKKYQGENGKTGARGISKIKGEGECETG